MTKKTIPPETYKALREYVSFLHAKITDAGIYERERRKLHQSLFKTLHGDRLRNRETRIGKTLDRLVGEAGACPIDGYGLDAQRCCHKCGRKFQRKDIQLNIENMEREGRAY